MSAFKQEVIANTQNRAADPGRRDALLKYKLLGNALLEYCEFPHRSRR
jgi:hypothetical protein